MAWTPLIKVSYLSRKSETDPLIKESGHRLPLTGAKIPQIRKRGFRSQKTPISHHPRKGRSESKNPHFYTEHYKENGDFFDSGRPFLGWGEMGGF